MSKNVITTILFLLTLSAIGCREEQIPSIANPTDQRQAMAKPAIEQIDISKMPPLRPAGRMQDDETDAQGNKNQIVADLVANGKDSIPFLINQLNDETEMDRHAMNYWYQLYVGYMAHIILTDFFTDETEMNSTIPGFGWDEFLGRDKDKHLMGEEILRRYIRKHGRKTIKQRWQKMWNQNKDKIFWDEKCRCFKIN